MVRRNAEDLHNMALDDESIMFVALHLYITYAQYTPPGLPFAFPFNKSCWQIHSDWEENIRKNTRLS